MSHGFYEGTGLADQTFYGFKLYTTGDLHIDVIDDGTTPVRLPDDNIIDPEDDKAWVWSKDTIRLRGDNGHLLMEML
jgi:hypothetical protein